MTNQLELRKIVVKAINNYNDDIKKMNYISDILERNNLDRKTERTAIIAGMLLLMNY